jgi:hypothetical protein
VRPVDVVRIGRRSILFGRTGCCAVHQTRSLLSFTPAASSRARVRVMNE